MPRFDYIRPTSLPQAIELLNDPNHRCRLLAGGTDLMVYLHHQEPTYNRVIDISLLPELKTIRKEGNQIHLGAAVTFSEAMESELLQTTVPFLVEACHQVGSPQIRNTGTIGGNVANAAACADSLPVLVCLDAVARLSGPSGERTLSLTDLVQEPNHTLIERGEILVYFTFDVPPAGTKTAFIKLGRRKAQAISRLTMAVMGRLDAKGQVDFVHIAPGAATPHTVRFQEAEDALIGQTPTPERLAQVAHKTAEVMIQITGRRWSTEYKEPAVTALAERALQQVFLPAGKNGQSPA